MPPKKKDLCICVWASVSLPMCPCQASVFLQGKSLHRNGMHPLIMSRSCGKTDPEFLIKAGVGDW